MQLAFLFISLLFLTVSTYTVKQHSCECSKEATENSIYPNYTCSANKFNPTEDSKISASFTFRKPVHKLWISGTLENKVHGKFQPMLNFNKKEVCKEIANIATTTNPLFLMTYKTLKEAIPDFVHECPYLDIEIKNATFDGKHIPKFMLRGEYRSKIKTYTNENDESCLITTIINMES